MERELLLLGLLRRQQMHGYQLVEFIERDLSSCTDLKKSTAYFLLDKMTRRGWVRAHEEQAGNRPQRRVYALTDAGEAQFATLLRRNLAADLPATFTGDTGLLFLEALPPGEALTLLRERRASMEARLAEYRAIPDHPGSAQWLILHQITHLESELKWLDSVIRRLEQGAPELPPGSPL